MIEVVVSGAGGKLASPIIDAIADAEDLELSGLFNPNRGGSQMHGVEIVDQPDLVSGDVVVETAHPDAVFDNVEVWCRLGLAAVVGTSGFTADRLVRLGEIWTSDRPCLVVPNFSVGAVLMMRFAREAAARFAAVEIVEKHSSGKPDAPSGTSLATAAGIGEAGGSSVASLEELVEGARGAMVEGVRVHSIRLPGVIAQQEVVLSNPGEVLSIEHLSTSYESFVSGALTAIRGVGSLPPGVHVGLDAVL